MAKKIRVKRSSEPVPKRIVPQAEELIDWKLKSGTVSVGDTVEVNHYSFGTKWEKHQLLRITRLSDTPYFHFYVNPPGSITVDESRVRVVPVKKFRIKKTKENN